MTIVNRSAVARALALVLTTVLTGTTLISGARPANAHPHVWVTVETTVDYANGTVTGFTHKWTFDEMYAAMAIQGLDTNNDGNYDRKELAELAQVNIDGLKEFDYFTFPQIGSQPLKLAPPKDYWLEYTDGKLSLHMTTPLEQPVLAEAEGVNFAIYDPSFFIAFDFAKKDPIKLAGAPAGCQASVEVPKEDAELAQRLADAAKVDTSGSVGTDLGFAVAKSIQLSCLKS
ncbi:MAG: DUF1007 family protein [Hyphomicrobiaceae bacterium]|nr:DUF1007 family protein [Hyphomicrobiaceae bacterium]MCC0010495.1 DUF1007 family protein [Hyphomicrobiaceae bacterium]